jgi:4-hydroxy-3-polyprenylbenzoate decarboxylase
VIAKLGMDATRRSDDRPDWERALPPPEAVRRVTERLRGLP